MGMAIGIAIGFLAAIVATSMDWWQNPGGIFRDARGTDWTVVVETGVSWFAPVSVLACTTALLVVFLIARKR